MNLNQPLFDLNLQNQRRLSRIRVSGGRYHRAERRLVEGLWRWR